MAAAKKQSNRRGTTKSASGKGRKSTNKKTTKQQGVTSGFQTEIILLIILAASIILIISNLGMGGVVGAAISTASFGIMGWLAYVFPVLLFLCAVFLVSNSKNPLAYKKIAAAAVFFIFLCGLLQLVTEGYMSSTTLTEYYETCATYKTGGGILGGAICISTTSAFGIAGGYVIIILVLLISLILVTQKSFFGFIFRIWDAVCAFVKDGRDMYMEGQPERELKKELRAQERRQRREERVRELEEALAEEMAEESGKLVQQKPAEKKSTGFLEGTLLTPPVNRKKKTSKEEKGPEIPEISGDPEMFANESEINEKINAEINEQLANIEIKDEDETVQQPMFKIHRSEPDLYVEETKEPLVEEPAQEETREVIPGQPQRIYPEEETSNEEIAEEIVSVSVDEQEESDDSEISQDAESPSTEPVSESTVGTRSAKNPKSSQKEIESGIQNIQHEITQQSEAVKKEYHYPPLKLLKRGSGNSQGDSDEHLRKTAKKLADTLHNFGVNVTITNVSCGPTVTRYELQPETGVKVSRIVNLADDIKLNLATPDIRIEAPIPGKAAVGIEVPNKENHAVMLRELLQSQEFQSAKSKVSFAVGKDIAGKPVVTDIAKMPHLLIAGATGSGKSVCINTLIISILYKASPDEVKLIMIDPKVVELSVYNGIPHLFIPVVTDPKKAAGALNWAVSEMMGRYNTFAEFGVRNLEEYNRKVDGMRIPEGEKRPDRMPQIVIIVDELADLMMVAPGEVEDAICRLAQLARAAGIHLIIATQRPSVNVITGLIKANMPSRIAFSVSSGVDSRTILDMNGAEKLLGKGDMLFYPQGYQKPARLQGAFVSDEEVSSIVDFLAEKNPGVQYDSQIEQQVNAVSLPGGGAASGGDERDIYFVDAGKFIIEKEKASIGMLQRMFKIGFNRAARIMDQLCDAGVVGPEEGTKPRKVLMTAEEFENYIEESL